MNSHQMFKRIFFIMFALTFMSLKVNAQDTDESSPQQFEGFNLEGYTDSGEKEWDLEGETADIIGDTIKITNVNANYYIEDKMNLKAKTGTMQKDSGDIQLRKDVVITSESGAKLTTDSLDWEKEKDLVSTEDDVKITRESMVATGTGMEAHPNLKTAKLNQDVTVEITPEEQKSFGDKVVITSDGPMEIDQANNKAVFNENVVAIQAGGRELHADKVDLYFNPETNQIEKMVCTGNVVVIQGQNKSYSDKAIYYGKDQRVVLSGRPKLIMMTGKDGGMPAFNK